MPALHPNGTADGVCMTVPEATELARYLAATEATKTALEGCSLVVLSPE